MSQIPRSFEGEEEIMFLRNPFMTPLKISKMHDGEFLIPEKPTFS